MARSMTRRASAPAAPATPLVRDYSGGRGSSVQVIFDVRTVYDFVFSLSDEVGSTDDLPATDRRWVADAQSAMRTLFGESLAMYGSELCIVLAGLAVDRPEVKDAAGFVDLLSKLDDATVVRAILGE